MKTLDYILVAIAILVCVPILVLALEILAALFSTKRSPAPANGSGPRPRVAVLIPAHNEELHIAATIECAKAQLHSGDQILVVADNCSDRTGELAAAAGANVLTRQHATERGKGFALAAGMKRLESDAPQVVVLVDADTVLADQSIDSLVQDAIRLNAPVQAIYLLSPPENPSTKDRISAFAFAVKNQVRGLGAERLGVPCLLRGTGMAFPWEILKSANLATGNIVEDMQLGIELAIAGSSPRLCAGATVTGGLPDKAAAATTQRTRWEHGHLQTIFHNAPKLLGTGLLKGRISLWALALDLAVPPLALVVLLWAVLTVVCGGLAWGGLAGVWPVYILGAAGVVMAVSIVAAWLKFAQGILPFGTLIKVPFYVAWKIPLYVGFLFKRQRSWVRTAR